jgi:hypothetical protein
LALQVPTFYHFVGSLKDMNTVRNEGHIKQPKAIGKRNSNQKPLQTAETILDGVQHPV